MNLQVLLCSLSGDIFPKAQQAQQQPLMNSSAKDEHLRQMLGMVGDWVGDPQGAVHQAAASEEAPLLDACRSALVLFHHDFHACIAFICSQAACDVLFAEFQ